ncbi:Protein of unknown function [Propionibacterium freudenreichii]|jgi:urease accessory protein
MSAA